MKLRKIRPTYVRQHTFWKALLKGLGVTVIVCSGVALLFYWWWGTSGHSSWPGIGPYRILEVGIDPTDKVNSVRVYEAVPDLGKGRVLSVPLVLKIPSYGYPGEYEVRGLYPLSLAETGKLVWFERSIEEGLGLAINGVIVRDQADVKEPSLPGFHELIWHLLANRQITIAEWLSLTNMIQSLSADIGLVQIESLTSFNKQTDVDGSEYISLYSPGFDSWYEKVMPILSTGLREITVTVENTTLKEGRGATVSRIFDHQGFSVLNVTDGLAVMTSEILMSETVAQEKIIVRVLQSMFPGIPVRIADISGYRASIVVRIASDW